jgi:hypothetical protein
MLIFFNNDQQNSSALILEEKLTSSFLPGKIEVYHETHSLMHRLRQGIYNIQLLVVCIVDNEILSLLETIRSNLCHVPIVFFVHGKAGVQTGRLYAFFPRTLFYMGEDDGLVLPFVKAKMGAKSPMASYIQIPNS